MALCHGAKDIYSPLGSKGWLLGIVIIIVIATGNEIKKQIAGTLSVSFIILVLPRLVCVSSKAPTMNSDYIPFCNENEPNKQEYYIVFQFSGVMLPAQVQSFLS